MSVQTDFVPGAESGPFGWYQRMRDFNPVDSDPDRSIWRVFRYEDVRRVLSDHRTFSSRFGDLSLLNADPPHHRELRALVRTPLEARAVDALRPRIERAVEELLKPALAAGRMDLVEGLASPLPALVIAELLGIPGEDRHRFNAWSRALVGRVDSTLTPAEARREIDPYLASLVEARRQHGGGDLIGALLQVRAGSRSLSVSELTDFCVLLMMAGHDTTTTLLGNAVLCLDEAPGAAAELRAHPELVPAAIEEVARYRSPVQAIPRLTTTEVEVAGCSIPAGRMVMAFIGSANRDPRQFPDPDRFDIRRSPNRHLAFGQGGHFCLGAPLARLEAAIALRALLSQLPGLRVDHARPLRPLQSIFVHGVQSLPVVFKPAAAKAPSL